jgi:hypothetical protein
MSIPIVGPGDRYRVSLELLSSDGSDQVTRHWVTEGEPVWDMSGQGGSLRVIAPDAVSLLLMPGENGLTVSNVRLLNAKWAVVTAKVTAGGGAPDWLPGESSYLLFQGDRAAAQNTKDRFIPLDGMAAERSWPQEDATPLDALAVAVGRSVARANAALARTQAEAGVALVSSVTIRVAVQQTDLGGGRVLVTLGRLGQESDCGQYVELTMTTVPGAPADDGSAAPAGGTTVTTATAVGGRPASRQSPVIISSGGTNAGPGSAGA